MRESNPELHKFSICKTIRGLTINSKSKILFIGAPDPLVIKLLTSWKVVVDNKNKAKKDNHFWLTFVGDEGVEPPTLPMQIGMLCSNPEKTEIFDFIFFRGLS